jgi:hypothetical protein
VSITDIRDGIATNLATISGLRTSAELPDQPSPPIAVVQLNNVTYDQAFQNGLVLYNFTITVIVGKVAERLAQQRLNAYASTGAGGVKTALESDRTLGGSAFDVKLQEMTNIGAITLGEQQYLAAEFAAIVYAD